MGVNQNMRQVNNARVARGETPLRRHHYIPQMMLRRLYEHCHYLEVFSVEGGIKSLGFSKSDNVAYEVGDIRDRNIETQERWYALTESRFSNFMDMVASNPFNWTPEMRGDDVRILIAGLIARNPHLSNLPDENNPYKWLRLKAPANGTSKVKQTKKLATILNDRCEMKFMKAAKHQHWGFGDVPWTIWDDSLVIPVSRNLALQFFKRGESTPETIRLTTEETQNLAAAFLNSSVKEYYIAVSQETYGKNQINSHFVGETYCNQSEADWEKFHHNKALKTERTQEVHQRRSRKTK